MRSGEARHIALLKRTFLFAALADEQLAELATACCERHYARGELVFQKGDPADTLYVVVTGKLKEACQSLEGQERIIELLGPHQTCGEAALLLDSPHPFYAAALVGSQLLHVNRNAIDALIDRAPRFVERLLLRLSGRVIDTLRDIEAASLKSPVQRVAEYLIDLQATSTGRQPAAAIPAIIPATKGVIASRLGMTPEALSRAFRDLANAGIIEMRGYRVQINDLPRLREFSLP